MTSSVITVIAVVVGIAWLGVLLVSALRNRGKEEVPPNLKPGINDQELETTRLETGQKAAIAFSAFLAISLPLYFLSEPARQEGFAGTITTLAAAQEPAVQALLGLPSHVALAAVMPLGRPAKPITRLKRKSVEEFAMLERWGGPPLAPGRA